MKVHILIPGAFMILLMCSFSGTTPRKVHVKFYCNGGGAVDFRLQSVTHTFKSQQGVLDLDSLKIKDCREDELFDCFLVNRYDRMLFRLPDRYEGQHTIAEICRLSGEYKLESNTRETFNRRINALDE